MKNKLLYITILFFVIGCENDRDKKTKHIDIKPIVVEPKIERPDFNADSAYLFVQQQVDFGPRFPNNEAHGKCAKYLENKLKSYGLNTITQVGKAKTFNNKEITIKNIIGAYNPDAKKRILLFAHWDSRPFADQDVKDKTKPILGANDGASGVGILIEVARQLSLKKPKIGVDIIFFDAEDYGEPSGIKEDENSANTWCLGSQYWANNLHQINYTAEYGILLDMVGASNANFTMEGYSVDYAPEILQKVWDNARSLGYSNYFVSKKNNYITDDHLFINKITNIPSIDIIHSDKFTGSFHPSWHTHKDDMGVIDKATLSTVGEVLLYTIYTEN